MPGVLPAVVRNEPARWALLAVTVFTASVGASVLRPEGSSTSLWWPAAGLAVAGTLLLPRRRLTAALLLVFAVTAVANQLTGRSWALSACFGGVNAAEVTVVVHLLRRGRREPALEDLRDVARLVLAAAAGAVTAAATAALSVLAVTDGDPLVVLRSVATSHLSAFLLLVPLALRLARRDGEAGLQEAVLQVGLLVALVVLCFGPDQDLPISFLPLVALVWAAARLSASTAVVQLVLVGLAVTAATVLGWGPYRPTSSALAQDPFVSVNLVQAFLVVSSVVTLAVVAAVHERRVALARLQRLALHDELTGLPNRRLLLDELDRLRRPDPHAPAEALAVLAVDLDGFKEVNDTLGHERGDALLVEVAARLMACVRSFDVVARTGGDEFVVLCPGLPPGGPTDELVARIDAALRCAVHAPDGRLTVSGSVGVASVVDGSWSASDALREADAAMYAVKRARHRGRRPASRRGDDVEAVLPRRGATGKPGSAASALASAPVA